MRYSILGCGWLGFPLGKHLAENGHLVKGSTTSTDKINTFQKENIVPFLLTVENDKNTDNIEAFLDADILVVAIPFGRQKEHFKAYQLLAKQIEASPVQKVVFISSTSVYSNTNAVVFEDAYYNPNPAKQVLVDLEDLFLQHPGFNTTVLRFSGLIGGSRKPGNFFKAGRTVQNGLAPINLIHLDDCINVIETIVAKDCWGEVFNAAADSHPTRKEFYTAATQQLGNTPAVFIENTDFPFKIISNKKLKEKLDYTFIHGDLMQLVQ